VNTGVEISTRLGVGGTVLVRVGSSGGTVLVKVGSSGGNVNVEEGSTGGSVREGSIVSEGGVVMIISSVGVQVGGINTVLVGLTGVPCWDACVGVATTRVTTLVRVRVRVAVGVEVAVGVGVPDGVTVWVGVKVGVKVAVGVDVGAKIRIEVGVRVLISEAVGVGVLGPSQEGRPARPSLKFCSAATNRMLSRRALSSRVLPAG